ncbi:ABC transporter permease [Ruixingdingia sedimenti]|uniref:ABC transporter permease n=1 Tax=Ruixingdingia sedimenti TaxID=3073604 RepID=A0ABU1FAB4_9RHOB|nr:ABC transporter permease [Xinfangfangia sp. LG-4]MDR5653835.1 ABC transporter permease [Xinfangfangia sp. LG-4]
MRALDRKLIRDLRRIWAQSLAIALVLGCGVMVLVLAQGAERSLTGTRDAYYERNRFADVFAGATRAPRDLLADIAQLDGVAQAEGRISFPVVLDIPGLTEPAAGRVISLPAGGEPLLNLPLLRQGRMPDPLRDDEVLLSEDFARTNALAPGARFRALLNGQLRDLTVAGLALSPEFIYLIGPGTIMPDDRRYGVIWMNETAAAAAKDLTGAFNEVTLRLTRDGRPEAVIAALDRLLEPYGGTGAHGRDRQTSHAFLQSELDQLGAMALILPPVFLIVSAFLVNMVLGRLIALERQQIGLLKAVGYTTREIAGHYLRMSIGIGIGGVAAGWAAGIWLGHETTQLYAEFYRFPYLLYAPGGGAFAVSGLAGIATVILGALRAVWGSVRLSPAAAMSPPAPPVFRRGLADRMGALLRLRQTTMMILRSITRWPGRAAVTLFGVSASVAVLVASFFAFDASRAMVDEVFHRANRQHVTLQLTSDRTLDAIEAAGRLPGVLRVEGGYALPVRLIHGHREKLLALQARAEGAELTRLLDPEGRPVPLPAAGLVLPESLAADLGAGPGDVLAVELLVPPREVLRIPVTGVVRQSLGQTPYIRDDALHALMRQAPVVNQLDLLVDTDALPALHAAVKQSPAIAGITLWTDVRRQFDQTLQENLITMTVIYVTLGVLITVGVVYNAARIQLSERAHELASLRVLGFTRFEVGYVLVGELMLLTVVAIPVGWLAGYGFAALMAQGISTDLFRIPLVIAPQTYAIAALVAFWAALASALVVRRRLDRVDIATALKRRE